MKSALVISAIAAVFAALPAAASQTSCGPVAVRSAVEVGGPDFRLADLLTASSCAALLEAASRVRLGSTPLPGSARVLEGADVEALLQKVFRNDPNSFRAWSLANIPERIIVRRSGARASCAEIGREVLRALSPRAVADEIPLPSQIDCGAAGRVPAESPLEPAKIRWNRALRSWEISARCVRERDCVPFLVRVRGEDSLTREEGSISASPALLALPETAEPAPHIRNSAEAPTLGAAPLVRAGENATLTWDQAGIRLTVPVVCLEAGAMGQRVRVRVRGGGRVLPAVVESAGQLRAAG
ncbi:MAG TPA: flagella basal body P-ring formation protein FlgA [Candidatus Acidoferrales bacterium]|nr:flagella basal body P-ring formation protein FlgA [Candidatus Acidoferrales bacterium]